MSQSQMERAALRGGPILPASSPDLSRTHPHDIKLMSRGPDLNFLKNFWKKFQIAVRGWDREREGGVTLSTTRSRNRHIPRTAFRDDFSLLQPPHPAVHAIATGSLAAPEAARNLGGYMGVTGRTKRTFVDNADGISTAATA